MKYRMLTEEEVRAWLGVPVSTLRDMRSKTRPDPIPFTKIGRLVRYREDLLLKWIERNTFFSTDEYFEKKTG